MSILTGAACTVGVHHAKSCANCVQTVCTDSDLITQRGNLVIAINAMYMIKDQTVEVDRSGEEPGAEDT